MISDLHQKLLTAERFFRRGVWFFFAESMRFFALIDDILMYAGRQIFGYSSVN